MFKTRWEVKGRLNNVKKNALFVRGGSLIALNVKYIPNSGNPCQPSNINPDILVAAKIIHKHLLHKIYSLASQY